MTPGYQARIGAGNAGVNAAAAAGGTLNSGNQLLALQKTAQNNGGRQLQQLRVSTRPVPQPCEFERAGISNVDTGLGSSLNANQNTLANLNFGAQTGIGNANASADLANQGLGLGLLGGLGKAATTAIPGSSIAGRHRSPRSVQFSRSSATNG